MKPSFATIKIVSSADAGNMKSVSNPCGELAVFASQKAFATIKKPAQAGNATHAGLLLPPTAKFTLHDKHQQSDKDIRGIPVNLQREQKCGSHGFSFLAPSVYALGVSCVKRNRARGSRDALSFATNVTLQEKVSLVYMEEAYG